MLLELHALTLDHLVLPVSHVFLVDAGPGNIELRAPVLILTLALLFKAAAVFGRQVRVPLSPHSTNHRHMRILAARYRIWAGTPGPRPRPITSLQDFLLDSHEFRVIEITFLFHFFQLLHYFELPLLHLSLLLMVRYHLLQVVFSLTIL